MRRADLLRTGVVAAGTVAFGPAFWRAAYGATARPGPSPYGSLRRPDRNGVMLPARFTSRVVARGGARVGRTGHEWHLAADGGATFATRDGGWIYVSNSERPLGLGGAGAIRFTAGGRVADAYDILGDTSLNCSGGGTPWGTWLSAEEWDGGRVHECDPTGRREAVARPALGVFAHEAVAVDPVRKRLYLTEDRPDGRLYRFTPERYPDLRQGRLEVAVARATGTVGWAAVPDPSAGRETLRAQTVGATGFDGGEGVWYGRGTVHFTTKGDGRVWSLAAAGDRLRVLYDPRRAGPGSPLQGVDNVIAARSGDLLVAEDGGNMEVVLITRERRVAPLLRLTGAEHDGSEVTGIAFDPSGRRLYLSSQRGGGGGITYEVAGPFRR
jgi:secreted PhoX family phosphatase